jgi:hypothetical protein
MVAHLAQAFATVVDRRIHRSVKVLFDYEAEARLPS